MWKNEKRIENCFLNYFLIIDLGTILVDSQQGLTKTNPYAYQPILTCKKTNKLIPLLVDYFNKLILGK